MTSVTIYRPHPDGPTARFAWNFSVEGGEFADGWALRLTSYGVERRPEGARKWRKPVSAERWTYGDERRYYSGLGRPTEIPADVLDEAIARAQALPLKLYIGFRNSDCRYDPAKGKSK